MVDQGGNIVRHLLKGKWAINVGGMSMSLQLNGDDLPVLSERPPESHKGTFGLALVLMTVAAVAACFVPAWRATRRPDSRPT